MTPVIPLIPAILGFAGTMVQSLTQQKPDKPIPQKIPEVNIDQELRDAARRRGRQQFAGDSSVLVGGPIGASRTLGVESQTLIGGG